MIRTLVEVTLILVNTAIFLWFAYKIYDLWKILDLSVFEFFFTAIIVIVVMCGAARVYFAISNDGIIVTRYTVGVCQPDGITNEPYECMKSTKEIFRAN